MNRLTQTLERRHDAVEDRRERSLTELSDADIRRVVGGLLEGCEPAWPDIFAPHIGYPPWV